MAEIHFSVQVEMYGVVRMDFSSVVLCLSIVTNSPSLAIKVTSVREHSFMGCIIYIYRTFYTEDESLKEGVIQGTHRPRKKVCEKKHVGRGLIVVTSSKPICHCWVSLISSSQLIVCALI